MSVQSYIRAVPNLTILQGGAVQKINFRALVDDYGPAVLNTAIRILGDSQKAQDVHQEVFLAIWLMAQIQRKDKVGRISVPHHRAKSNRVCQTREKQAIRRAAAEKYEHQRKAGCAVKNRRAKAEINQEPWAIAKTSGGCVCTIENRRIKT